MGRAGKKNRPFILSDLYLDLSGHMKNAPYLEQFPVGTLKKAEFSLIVDGSKEKVTGHARGDDFKCDLEISNFITNQKLDIADAKIDFNADAKQFPVEVLSGLLPGNTDYAVLIGETLSLKTKGYYHPSSSPQAELHLDAKGEGFTANLALAADKSLTLTEDLSSANPLGNDPEKIQYTS